MTKDPSSEFAGTAAVPAGTGAVPLDTSFFGHPAGLSTLFFTEMWERFSYYGMRALLLLFMTAPLAGGGLGWSAAKAGPIYGLYTAGVYLMSLPGGWLADRIFGQRRSVLYGGILIASGHLCLTFHGIPTFYLGLFLIVLGTGLLKPNVSAIVGTLYGPDDKRRDAGFSLFYMGINLGAFIAPFITGYLAQGDAFKAFLVRLGLSPESSWHWGFGAAAVGMTIGLVQYVLGGRRLGAAGLQPSRPADPALAERQRRHLVLGALAAGGLVAVLAALLFTGVLAVSAETVTRVVGYSLVVIPIAYFGVLFARRDWTPVERKRLMAIAILFLFAALFWSAFEQAGSTLNLFADRFTRNVVLGFHFPSSWFQSVNSMFVWSLAPVFAWLWLALGRREPSSPSKFAYGLFFVGAGFLVVALAALVSGPAGQRVSPLWLVTVYLCHTIGELCISPVGLSAMTKLAPARVATQMMGIWFLATSVGNFVGGQVAGVFEKFPLPYLFGAVFAVSMLFTLLAVVMVRPVKRLMAGVN